MKVIFKKEIKNQEKITPQQILEIILKNRQIKDLDSFLNPVNPLNISLFDFHKSYKDEFKKVIDILKEIKKNQKMIVVYTDYDADGITGGAILWETLYLLGFKVMPYVPDRKNEGYGFSITGIDNVIKQFNPFLTISVDHGITKIKEVEYAQKKGIKIIITDHHLKGEKFPQAEAIFHIPALSGSGVAYFFAKEIFNYFKSQTTNYQQLTTNFSIDYLALASIGTIADLVPLVDYSRSVIKYGLEAFSKINRLGIKKILKQAGIEGKKITPYEVGFIIAPRINAVGRLTHAIDALRLLCTINENRAHQLAFQIGNLNTQRQNLVEKSVEQAKTLLKKQTNNFQNLPKLIILKSHHWHEGIIGLIASKIVEEFYRPTIVLTKTDGHYKASARSITNFHITNFLRSLKSFLVDVGGHSQAAGFTIDENQLDNFCTAAQELSITMIKNSDLEKTIEVDLKIPISKINLELVKKLDSLAPYGVGNREPTFYTQGQLIDAKLFGKKNEHLKIIIKDLNKKNLPSKNLNLISTKAEIQQTLELIAFNKGNLFSSLSRGQKIDVVYSLEVDRWGEREKVRGKLIF